MTAECYRIQKPAVRDRRYSRLATANAASHRLPPNAWYAILPFEAEEGHLVQVCCLVGASLPALNPIFP
jgi:hypothetical protein